MRRRQKELQKIPNLPQAFNVLAKPPEITYTFTEKELQEHDRLVLQSRKDKLLKDAQEQAHKYNQQNAAKVKKMVHEEFEKRQALFFTDDREEQFLLTASALLYAVVDSALEECSMRPDTFDRKNTTRHSPV